MAFQCNTLVSYSFASLDAISCGQLIFATLKVLVPDILRMQDKLADQIDTFGDIFDEASAHERSTNIRKAKMGLSKHVVVQRGEIN